MRFGDRAAEREAQAGAGATAIARAVDPGKPLEEHRPSG
jgi:ApbE superfamily uncharacterized protein (UPF0280 family)